MSILKSKAKAKKKKEQHDPADSNEYYRLKRIRYGALNGIPICLQNKNGPCPLLAIANALLLRGNIKIHPDLSYISEEQLIGKLTEYVHSVNKRQLSKIQEDGSASEEVIINNQANLAEVIALLPKLKRGIDVNVRYGPRCDSFEFTKEVACFDMFRTRLVHGWLADPIDVETYQALGGKSFNQVMDILIAADVSNMPQDKTSNAVSRPTEAAKDEASEDNSGLKKEDGSEDVVDRKFEPLKTTPDEEGNVEGERDRSGIAPKEESGPPGIEEGVFKDADDIAKEMSEGPVRPSLDPPPGKSPEELRGLGNKADAISGNLLVDEEQMKQIEGQTESRTPLSAGDGERRTFIIPGGDETQDIAEDERRGVANDYALLSSIGENDEILNSIGKKPDLEDETDDMVAVREQLTDMSLKDKVDANDRLAVNEEAENETGHTGASRGERCICSNDVKEPASGKPSASEMLEDGPPGNLTLESPDILTRSHEADLGDLEDSPDNEDAQEHVQDVIDQRAFEAPETSPGEPKQSVKETEKSNPYPLVDAVYIQEFLNAYPSQLTYYGLAELHKFIGQGEMCVFFRNNHFSTITRDKNSLYVLVSDLGYLHESDVVWEKLNDLSGNTEFTNGSFVSFATHKAASSATPAATITTGGAGQGSVEAPALMPSAPPLDGEDFESDEAYATYLARLEAENADAAYARRLHQEEERKRVNNNNIAKDAELARRLQAGESSAAPQGAQNRLGTAQAQGPQQGRQRRHYRTHRGRGGTSSLRNSRVRTNQASTTESCTIQ
eukprot:Plantae.Rhodophyta-Hildenbrandia_rubra.ctg4270.p1 GENE.Plantae.Rhodophyta-Hildenbrandia_rubra.ctg4270~~Plantae.Rhodophyta-Hildenbrandia_rubra.ctg4270.p1  ORF type:complete len:785 (+),score=159.16 Plantae.Rhodophyta-Hildenbrandia_rubra.ctg4270:360-2714(+)